MQLKNNSQRAKWILTIFYIMLILSPIVIISDIMEYSLLGRQYTTAEGEANDLRQSLIGMLDLVVYIFAIVFFIMWFRRAYFNLQAAGVRTLHTDGWAAGCWFVPILNLFRPYQIMEEIWEQTQNKIQQTPMEPKIIIGVWWGLMVINGILDRISTRLLLNAETIEDYQMSSFLTMITDSVTVIPLILIILIIRKVSTWEEKLYSQSYEMPIEEHLI